ncbi:MAG: hypothetical protein LBG72_01815 [Spirochaetaceae bacterium]|jgi:hypothetical protein|nr:hypothetical protein [Spirochaetaceae bacterium]
MANAAAQTDGRQFLERLAEAVERREAYLEKTEIPALKEDLKIFRQGLAVIFSLLAAKGYITEDPYKNDLKVDKIEVPENTPVQENNRRDQMGRRLSQLDNQFDMLCNFFPLSTASINQETIKQILALVNYIEWNRISATSDSPMTAAVADMINTARKSSKDAVFAAKINEALQFLECGSEKIIRHLKTISDFGRERYKLEIRKNITEGMSPNEKTLNAIKAKFDSVLKGQPFYKELAEEIIREDTSAEANALRSALFVKLKVEEEKESAPKNKVALKPVLIQGLNALGASSAALDEIIRKLQENNDLFQARKKGFFYMIAHLFAHITNKDGAGAMYSFDVFDPAKNAAQKIEINFNSFVSETEKKSRILAAMAPKGSGAAKIESMDEGQLVLFLKKNMRDVLNLHKILTGLDDYFKNNAVKDMRSKIKGIKPELSEIKAAHSQANRKLIDYGTEREMSEQYKKLGVQTELI